MNEKYGRMNRWLDRAHGEAVPCFLLPRVTHFPFDRFPQWKSLHLVRIEHAKFMAIVEELSRIRSTDIVVTLRRVREKKKMPVRSEETNWPIAR